MVSNSISLVLSSPTPAEAAALAVARRLRDAGHAALLVGGAVRDRLLGRAPVEVDVATDAVPDRVQALFARTVAVGAQFGVVVVVAAEHNVEVATFRTDGAYQDGRRPDSVRFCGPRHDAERRDFTVNGLFYDPETELVIDYVGGLDDLRRGVIRAIGEPDRRFADDFLRMLRAVRFAARFGFRIDDATLAAIGRRAGAIRAISSERIFSELTRMLTGRRPDKAVEILEATGLLAELLPEVAGCRGVTQPAEYHPEGDVWRHTVLALSHLVHPSKALAWATLLHDVGKPPTRAVGPSGRETFCRHAVVGAETSREILGRLRAPGALTEAVATMIHYHMAFADVRRMRPATLRRMLARPTFADELELHRLDCRASHGSLGHYAFLLDRLGEYRDTPPVPPPLIGGRDVLAAGLAPGPAVGKLLAEAEELQLNGVLDDRRAALCWLADRATQTERKEPDDDDP